MSSVATGSGFRCLGVAAHLVRGNADEGEVDADRVPTVRSLPVGWWLLVLVVGVRLSGQAHHPHITTTTRSFGVLHRWHPPLRRHSTPRTQFRCIAIDHLEAASTPCIAASKTTPFWNASIPVTMLLCGSVPGNRMFSPAPQPPCPQGLNCVSPQTQRQPARLSHSTLSRNICAVR